uniref:Putative scf e3 ubiquitin ligase complex f-box protein grra n=1 Tax=Culex tarsalis TaxID=7177 RepID=A0A1Q3FKD0_CULTA
MPRLGQPARLEDMALKRSATWLCVIAENLMPIMLHMSRNREENDGPKILKHIVSDLRDEYDHCVPAHLFDEFGKELIEQIKDLIERVKRALDIRASMAKFLAQVNVAIAMSEILLSRKLRSLKIDEMPKMMRHVFYSRMSDMKGLKYLSLGSMTGGWKTFDMQETIMKGMVTMMNLTGLTLNYDCTDTILQGLAKCCPNLEYVDISNSKYITNDSIEFLVKLKNLKVALLHRTQVTISGMIELLVKAKNLTDLGRYDELGRCLEFIDQNYPQISRLKLRKFETRFATTRHIQLLSELCPDLYYVSIFHNMLLMDLMSLIGINNLSELYLLSCDFFADQIRDVLQVKGCNLTCLHLEHVDQIDMNALIYISQYCVDLKILSLYNCVMIPSTSLYTRRYAIPPFMNLEKLWFVSDCAPQYLEFILVTALKIKFIQLGTQVFTSDEMFERILLRNPLQYLEDIRIINSEELTIATAYRLVENCPSLVILNEIECWKKVRDYELVQFQEMVKERNYAVHTAPLRKYATEQMN